MEHCVVLYRSIHDVLCAERALLASRLWHDLVPVPKELSADCGMAVELERGALEAALETLRARCRPWTQVYLRDQEGAHAPISAPSAGVEAAEGARPHGERP